MPYKWKLVHWTANQDNFYYFQYFTRISLLQAGQGCTHRQNAFLLCWWGSHMQTDICYCWWDFTHRLTFVTADGGFICRLTCEMKWNDGVLGHFLNYEGWIGPGTGWVIKVKFLWNLPQSSIEPATFYSEFSVLLLDHGGPP